MLVSFLEMIPRDPEMGDELVASSRLHPASSTFIPPFQTWWWFGAYHLWPPRCSWICRNPLASLQDPSGQTNGWYVHLEPKSPLFFIGV